MADNYKVKDIRLADWGRKEITIAESEMPGPHGAAQGVRREQAAQGRAHRRLPAHDHPDRGAHRDAHELGAEVTWTSCNIFSTQDHAAAAIAEDRRPRLRLEGRDRGGVRRVHRAAAQGVRRRQGPEHDPRRRRRPHASSSTTSTPSSSRDRTPSAASPRRRRRASTASTRWPRRARSRSRPST